MFIQENPENTSNIKFDDLSELIKERNFNQHNPITINYSTYYGIEKVLKEYANFSKNYEIKAYFEHGIAFTASLEAGFRIHECLPTITCSEFRKNTILSQKNNNGAYSIGPHIAYAKPLLNNEKLLNEKEKIGRNLLVFPAHSTPKTDYSFKLDYFTEEILNYSKDFDTTTICLYWADIVKGFDKYYKDLGFNIVTAGYMTDPLFLNRLRSIIELSDVTLSNNLGSHVGYCIYLNKPHYFIPTKEKLVRQIDSNKKSIRDKLGLYLENEYATHTNQSDVKKIEQVLTEKNQNKEKVIKTLDYYYGFSQVKSSDELRNIILDIEKKFSKAKFFLTLPKLMKYYASIYYKAYKYY